MNLNQRIIMFFATGFYTGYSPFAPGTFGTLPGLLLCWVISFFSLWIAVAALSVFILFSIFIADQAETITGHKDPGLIVIDEMAGMGATLLGLPFTLTTAVIGFLVFRFFDILKPFPIGYLEKKFTGGLGITIDDVAAGIIGNILLRVVFHYTGIPSFL